MSRENERGARRSSTHNNRGGKGWGQTSCPSRPAPCSRARLADGSWRASVRSGASSDAIRVERAGKMRRSTTMTKGCLYCGRRFPDTAAFCPQCGRRIEEAARVERTGKMERINVATGCLYCGLQLPATAEFCPQCGRPLERGFAIRPMREFELDWLRKQMKGKREFSSFQSNQPMRSRVRRVRAASAFRRRARRRHFPHQQSTGNAAFLK
jgi:RNA polymerase subunit RPABC4/transcription elongation factor Spt4